MSFPAYPYIKSATTRESSGGTHFPTTKRKTTNTHVPLAFFRFSFDGISVVKIGCEAEWGPADSMW